MDASWRTASGGDANSSNINPGFLNAGSTTASDYNTSASLPGVTGTGITTDYAGTVRSVTPKMGAYESNAGTYVWQGSISDVFGTSSNWVGGVVPPDGADISFAITPANNCVLDQNRTLGSVTNAQSTYKLTVNGKQLTLNGNLTFSNSAQIDASLASSVVVFAGSSAQSIPSGAFVSNTADGLTLNNVNGLTLNGDLTVAQTLTLTNGAFSIGANTLSLNGAVSSTSGTLTGGSSSNITFGGSGAGTTLPAVLLNNLTLNRANGISLGGAVTVSSTLVLTSGTLTLGANTFTLSGSSPTRTSGNIDASNAGATLVFANTGAITLPASVFSGSLNNLTISGAGGITAGGDITVNGVLNLSAANPSATKGLLEMTINYTNYPGTLITNYLNSYILNLGATASTTGTGDVTGTIKRATIVANTPYSFGHQYTTVSLTTGTMPSALAVTVTIGTTPGNTAPSDDIIRGAIRRTYEIVPTGGSNCYVTANFHYLNSELTSSINSHTNTELKMTTMDYDIDAGGHGALYSDEHGRANYDYTNKYIGLSSVPISYFIQIPVTHEWRTIFTLRDYSVAYYTWNGSASTVWGTAANWTLSAGGSGIPNELSHVIIPDAGTTPNDPVLPEGSTTINTLTIENGGILTMGSNTLVIQNSFSGGWEDQNPLGNDPGTSTVRFTTSGTTISGTARFYNVEIADGADITNQTGSTMKIGNTVTKTGTGTGKWYADVFGATIEYNGGIQTVLLTDGSPHFHNLTLSGSGIKTLPSSALTLHGNLTTSGTASVTGTRAMTIGGNVTIGEGSTFNTGAYNHSVGGNFENHGTFTAVSTYSVTMNGTSAQWIGGTVPTSFYNLTVNNSYGVTVYSNVTVNNALTLTLGNLSLGSAILENSGTGSKLPRINYFRKTTNSKGTDNLLSNDYQLTIFGNLALSPGTKIDATSTSSLVEFAGSSAQIIPSGAFVNNTLHCLKVNNSNGLTLNGDLTVNGTLTLTDGLLNTGANTLSFGSSAVDPVETSASRIVGTARIQNVAVGLGTFSFLSCNLFEGTDDIGNVSVVRKTGPAGVVTIGINTSIACNWNITSDYAPSGGRTVAYKWLDNLDNGKGFSISNRAVNYCSTDNGVSWAVHGNPVDVSAVNPRVMTFTTDHFSSWVASSEDAPLPVSLSSLSSTVSGRNIKLSWTTAYEVNNSGFAVERKPVIGTWAKIGFIAGRGTVSTPSNYSYEDRFLTTGKYSYRLKQIDLNGNFEYHVLNAEVEIGVPSKFDLSQNYPNPFNAVTKINYELPVNSNVKLVIYDLTGREIKTLVNENLSAGYYTAVFDASTLASGIYIYRIISNAGGKDNLLTKKLVLVK